MHDFKHNNIDWYGTTYALVLQVLYVYVYL